MPSLAGSESSLVIRAGWSGDESLSFAFPLLQDQPDAMQVGRQHRQGNRTREAVRTMAANPVESPMLQPIDGNSGTTWAPMGQTPVVPATGKRFGLNLVSAVSPQGVLRFMVVDGRMTAVRFIAFLKRLLHNQTQPIFLIVDQHSSHRAKAVQEFVASTDGHLELFFLPPYSPELNPDELVWNHLKTHGVRKRLLQTPQELKRYVLGHMRSLQRTPALLRGFFKKPSLRYITA